MWRASKLDGVNVYNNANEKVGDISDVLFDQSGRIEAVVIGVGGFLGLGERNVAVPFDQIRWSNEPIRSVSSTPAPSGGGTGARLDTPALGVQGVWVNGSRVVGPQGIEPDAPRRGRLLRGGRDF